MLYIAIIVTLLCSFIIPIFAFFLFQKFYRGTGKAIIFGIMTFIISQIILRVPLLQILGRVWPTYMKWIESPNFAYCLFLGITAGLFEEGARYLVMFFLLKKQHTDVDAIAFGIGHGGIEAILIVGINYVILFYMMLAGTAVMSQTLVEGDVFLAGAERIFTIIFHIAWSLMVMKSIQKKKISWAVFAFVSHAFLDTSISYLAIKEMNIYMIEGILAILTIFPIIYIWSVSKKDKNENPHIFERIEGNNEND